MMFQQFLLVAIIATVNMVMSHEMENYVVEYDKSVNLTCMHSTETTIRGTQTLQWILPNGDLISSKTKNHDRVVMMENGILLHVRKVSDQDFGPYICLIHDSQNNNYAVIKKGINVNGPYWGNLLDKYRQGIIIGAIAAAIVFVLMIGLCYLFERNPVLVGRDSHYIADMEKPDDAFLKEEKSLHAYDNYAIELQESQGKGETVNGTSKQVEITVIEDNNTHL